MSQLFSEHQNLTKYKTMKAYKLEDWCGLGARIIVHPRGLPPGWEESNLSEEQQQTALAAVHSSPNQAKLRSGNFPHTKVHHLNPETLEVIESFNVR
jgi:hypothetical protein